MVPFTKPSVIYMLLEFSEPSARVGKCILYCNSHAPRVFRPRRRGWKIFRIMIYTLPGAFRSRRWGWKTYFVLKLTCSLSFPTPAPGLENIFCIVFSRSWSFPTPELGLESGLHCNLHPRRWGWKPICAL